jgi:hypothetical protein
MRLSLWVSSVALALGELSAAVSQVQPDPCVSLVSQPSDISLQLSLKNGQTVFREGEIIALTAEYTSSSEKKYYLNTRGYDRSGRLNEMDVFCIDPATAVDPLSDYFNGSMGFLGGGLSTEQDLSSNPHPINLELNEWATGYQCGPNDGCRFHVATASTMLTIRPSTPSTSAWPMGRFGASRAAT